MFRKTFAVIGKSLIKEGIRVLAYDSSAKYINDHYKKLNLNKISRFFKAKKALIRTYGGQSIKISFSSKILNTKKLYLKFNKVIHFSPHSDDICWAAETIKYFSKTSGANNVFSILFSSDNLGIKPNSSIIDLYSIVENFLSIQKREINLDQLRVREFYASLINLGVNFISHVKENDFYSPEKIVYSKQNIMFSYLSSFLRKNEIKNLLDKILSKSFSARNNRRQKILLLVPFVYDLHPVHQDVSKQILQYLINLPKKEQKKYEVWFYG